MPAPDDGLSPLGPDGTGHQPDGVHPDAAGSRRGVRWPRLVR